MDERGCRWTHPLEKENRRGWGPGGRRGERAAEGASLERYNQLWGLEKYPGLDSSRVQGAPRLPMSGCACAIVHRNSGICASGSGLADWSGKAGT